MMLKSNMRTTVLLGCLLLMIFDSNNVFIGAADGIKICLQVLIPSLFPYLLLTGLLTNSVKGKWSFLITGFLGGYPAGAQSIKTAYDRKQITKEQAELMLTYCNQAGPAFIFGMVSRRFTRNYIPWIIWLVHILSAFVIFLLYCKNQKMKTGLSKPSSIYTISELLERSIKAMALICGWVIIFRVIIQVINVRILHHASTLLKVTLSGLLELSNGCILLNSIRSEQLRFILCSAFLGFGGICVTFQTYSLTKGLKIKKYIIAKITQGLISALFAAATSVLIFR